MCGKAGVELPTYQAFYLENELDGVYRDAGFLEFVGRFHAPDPAALLPVPASLQGVLRPYQEEGFRWLQILRSMGFGGILADEMGLAAASDCPAAGGIRQRRANTHLKSMPRQPGVQLDGRAGPLCPAAAGGGGGGNAGAATDRRPAPAAPRCW